MQGTNEKLAWAGWLFGGVPIVASALRAFTVLSGTDIVTPIPVVGDISLWLQKLAAFSAAQRIAFNQVEIVLGLFVFLFAAWATLGVLMTGHVRRRFRSANTIAAGAVGVASLMYVFLFFGVYGSILSEGYPAGQVVFFFAVPVATATALGGSYYFYPWEDTQYLTAVDRARKAEATAEEKRAEFTNLLAEEIGDGYATITEPGEETEFVEECRSIESAAAEYTDAGTTSAVHAQDIDRIKRETRDLKRQADQLDPESAVVEKRDELEAQLNERVEAIERLEADLTTPDGDRLDVGNLPKRYSQIQLANEVTIVLSSSGSSLDEQLLAAYNNGKLTLVEAFEGVERITDHLEEELLPYCREHLSRLRPHVEEWADGTVERSEIESRFAEIDGAIGEALRELYVDGHDDYPEIVSLAAVEDEVERAKAAYTNCEFDEVEERVEHVESWNSSLGTAVDFFSRTYVQTLKDGGESVSFYSSDTTPATIFQPEVFEYLEKPASIDYGATYSIDEDERVLDVTYDDDVTVERSVTDDRTTSDDSSSSAPEEWQIDSVLDKLSERARTDDPVEINPSAEPAAIDEETITEVRAFLEEKEALIADDEDGTLVVESAVGAEMDSATRDLKADFSSWEREHGDEADQRPNNNR